MQTPTPRTMITFRQHGTKFNFRVAGVIINNGRVLFQYAERDASSLILPGGRAELGETTEGTLIREMREELGIPARIERLLYVVENLFLVEDTACHEILFIFLLALQEAPLLYEKGEHFAWKGEEEHLEWGWFAIAQLPELPIYPQFLRTALTQLPDHTQHVLQTT